MISLPQPEDLTSLVLRTDFTNDAVWASVKAALRTWKGADSTTFASDPTYAGVSPQELLDTHNAASHDDKLTYLFLADATTMADAERARCSHSTWRTNPAAPSGCHPAGTRMSRRTSPSRTWTSPSSPTPLTSLARTGASTETDVLVWDLFTKD